jgi:hypothetical protein
MYTHETVQSELSTSIDFTPVRAWRGAQRRVFIGSKKRAIVAMISTVKGAIVGANSSNKLSNILVT